LYIKIEIPKGVKVYSLSVLYNKRRVDEFDSALQKHFTELAQPIVKDTIYTVPFKYLTNGKHLTVLTGGDEGLRTLINGVHYLEVSDVNIKFLVDITTKYLVLEANYDMFNLTQELYQTYREQSRVLAFGNSIYVNSIPESIKGRAVRITNQSTFFDAHVIDIKHDSPISTSRLIIDSLIDIQLQENIQDVFNFGNIQDSLGFSDYILKFSFSGVAGDLLRLNDNVRLHLVELDGYLKLYLNDTFIRNIVDSKYVSVELTKDFVNTVGHDYDVSLTNLIVLQPVSNLLITSNDVVIFYKPDTTNLTLDYGMPPSIAPYSPQVQEGLVSLGKDYKSFKDEQLFVNAVNEVNHTNLNKAIRRLRLNSILEEQIF
jgi:hypothetical protein